MLFADKIKQLREEQQLPQRQLAAALEIDTATYCKIEKGDRKARREQVVNLAHLLQIGEQELLSLWVADKVNLVVADEVEVASIALNIVTGTLKKRKLCQK